ncbi:DUF937 domain-containing protein [Apibacter raozihei]|uniref:DUF937 domain-containing protein n=1 Tax=Apibacter raozihei TaxID=2500547 RepID=UPI001E3A303E|nr:DUF937 domain-containing protein [Apibacter raozihei]
MNITDLFNSDLGKQIIEGIGQKTGTTEKETSSVIASAVPALLGALQNNATSTDGANGILGALTSSNHSGSILDNLSGFFTGSDNSDGKGILGHIFGSQQKELEESISSRTGVSSGKVSQILILLAPIVMGYLGKLTQKNNVENTGGLTDMLSGMLGGTAGSSILSKILDQNGDGKLGLDDLGSFLSGDKKEGLGGIFGKIFGK